MRNFRFLGLLLALIIVGCGSANPYSYNPSPGTLGVAGNNTNGGGSQPTVPGTNLTGRLSVAGGAIGLGAAGTPLAGASVSFNNPVFGFTVGPVTTDSNGQFTLPVTAGGTGTLTVTGSAGSASFAVTAFNGVTASTDPPAVSRSQAMSKVQAAIAGLNAGKLLFLGPQNPLPAGVTVNPMMASDTSGAFVTSSPQWFFYVDPQVGVLFSRSANLAVRYYFVDAQSGAVQEFNQGSWPSINGTEFYSEWNGEVTSADLIAAPPGAAPVPLPAKFAPKDVQLLSAGVPATAGRTYALLVQGSTAPSMYADMFRVQQLLTDGKMKSLDLKNPNIILRSPFPPLAMLLTSTPDQAIPVGESVNRPDPVGDIGNKFLTMASQMKPEDTVVIYLTCHGDRGKGVFLELAPVENGGTDKTVNRHLLAADIVNLIKLCPAGSVYIIVEACYSGQFLPKDPDPKQFMNGEQDLFAAGLANQTGKKIVVLTGEDSVHEGYGQCQPRFQVGALFTSGFTDEGNPDSGPWVGPAGTPHPGLVQSLGAIALQASGSGLTPTTPQIPGRVTPTFGTLNIPAASAEINQAFTQAYNGMILHPFVGTIGSTGKPHIGIRDRASLDAGKLAQGDPFFPPSQLITLDANGSTDTPTISQDGRYISFVHYAGAATGFYVYDTNTSVSKLVAPFSGPSSLSADGKSLAFAFNGADDLLNPNVLNLLGLAGVGSNPPHRGLFLTDLSSGSVKLLNPLHTYNYVSTTNNTAVTVAKYDEMPQAVVGLGSFFLAAGSDGSVVWPSFSEPPSDDASDVTVAAEVQRVGGANAITINPLNSASDVANTSPTFAVSSDGSKVAYAVNAGGNIGVRLFDRQNQSSTPVTSAGLQVTISDLTANGLFVAYASSQEPNVATPLPSGAGTSQIYVRRMDQAGTKAERVSVRGDSLPFDTAQGVANDICQSPSISQDGRFVAFTSFATNLIDAPFPGGSLHLFVKDRQTGLVALADRPFDINPSDAGGAWAGYSFGCKISGDGAFIAYVGRAQNLISPGSAVFPLPTYFNRIYRIPNPLKF